MLCHAVLYGRTVLLWNLNAHETVVEEALNYALHSARHTPCTT